MDRGRVGLAEIAGLNGGPISAEIALSVSDRELSGVGIGAVNERLYVHRPSVVEARREVVRNHNRELASAVVESGGQRTVVGDSGDQIKILGGLKALEKILAGRNAFGVARATPDGV